MARPAEKARAMLNKWVKMREQGNAPAVNPRQQKRPHLASECEHLSDAEYYRNQIIREITAGIAKIQNPGMGEHAIRELNDEINKRIREKYHWNKRIFALGGLDYNAIEKKRQIEEGEDIMGGQYRYFGAAKDLPGVKEILAKQAKKAVKKTNVWKSITPDYFGWRDEEDGVLKELEEKAVQEHSRKNKKRARMTQDELARDYLDVPTTSQIEKMLLDQKKKAMLAKLSI